MSKEGNQFLLKNMIDQFEDDKSQLFDRKTVERFGVISFDEVLKYRFSPGNLFWLKKTGNPIRIVGAGDVIRPDHINKFRKGIDGFRIDLIVNIQNISQGKIYFSSLKNSVSEEQKILQRYKIIRWLKDIYWDGKRQGSVLDIVNISEQIFYRFDHETGDRLRNTSVELYKRSSVISSLAVAFALGIGYTDFNFLSDIYNLCYLFDFSFDDKTFSFNLNRASQLEMREIGSGIEFLFLGDDPGPEMKSFVNHPEEGVTNALDGCSEFFYNPELLNLIFRHHERFDGNGFPNEINKNEMSDIDQLVVLLNHIVEYKDVVFRKNDGCCYFKNILDMFMTNEKVDKNSVRLESILVDVFENVTRRNMNVVGDNLSGDDEV